MGRIPICSLALVALLSAVSLAEAQTVPSGFTVESYGGSLGGGTAMAWAPDGRLFVTTQGGVVYLIKDGVLLPPFHTSAVENPVGGERGMLGICVDPDFATNGYVYVYYTAPTPNPHNVIRRLQPASPGADVSDGTETPILDLEDLGPSTMHNGGAIRFGGDGMLYVGVGENTVPANAQSITSRFGKILRLNPDGSIPSDNPSSFPGIVGTTSGIYQSIWAVGLRNPFRMAFQPGSMHLHINDVGEDNWEEINEGAAGANYGWEGGMTDGVRNLPNFTDPIFTYAHTFGNPMGSCITGGTFYNPGTVMFPASYLGKYFFTDFVAGFIYYTDSALPGQSFQFLLGAAGPVDLSVGPDGALYYLGLTGNEGVYRIAYSASGSQGLDVSTDAVTVNEGGTATFQVRLTANPGAAVNVSVTNAIGLASIAPTPSTLTFDGTNWNNYQTVTVSAPIDDDIFDNGATVVIASGALESKQVIVTAVDTSPPPPAGQPVARISQPRNGDVVSGSRAEYFGTGTAAPGSATVQAQFFIDGGLAYTDIGPGHYHLNGGHGAFDTTKLSNGRHVLRMAVTDDQGRTGSHEITVGVANTVSTPANKKCGASGLEGLVLMALLALRRWKP